MPHVNITPDESYHRDAEMNGMDYEVIKKVSRLLANPVEPILVR